MTSGIASREVIDRAHSLDADFVVKPIPWERFDDYLNFVIARCDPIDVLAGAVYEAARAWGLKPHETAVVSALLRSPRRDRVASMLGTPIDTLKSRIRTVLEKSGHNTTHEVEHAILERARQNSSALVAGTSSAPRRVTQPIGDE